MRRHFEQAYKAQISQKNYAHKDAARRGCAGFTLPEVLITLAIIIILLAISMPLVNGLRENLKMLELDTKAKEVYVATQDRLTNLFVSGEYATFKEKVEALDTATTAAADKRKLGEARKAAPPDYPADSSGATDTKWKDFYYITSEDDIFKKYLISDPTLSAMEGNFIIEFYPETADVYSVYYSEDHTVDEMIEIYNAWLYDARAKDDRRDFRVGYYSGNSLSVSLIPNSFKPSITVVNGEELYLTISCDDMLKFSTTLDKLTIKLTLTDEHGNSIEIEKNGKAPEVSTAKGGDTVTWNLLLDSMRDEEHFADITQGLDTSPKKGLTPGDNITAKVEFAYSYLGKTIGTDATSSDNLKIFNSLYADGTDVKEGEINVNRVRHLNNLRSSIFDASNENISKVTQTGDIDFDHNNWTETYADSTGTTYDEWCPTTEDKDRKNPLNAFAPIENADIFGNNTKASTAIFNGNGNEIRNFKISSGSNGTGLLAYTNCNLENIIIVDPKVTGGANTGALAGNVYGGKVDMCGVRLATKDNKGVAKTGSAMKTSVADHTVSGGNCVGGLIGRLSGNATVDSSYAAINVNSTSGSSIGGLVGLISSGSINKCYSSGDVTTSGQYAGGIAGQMTSGSIADCYSTSDITKATISGGFAGYVTGGSIKNCVSYGSVENKTNSAGFTATTSKGTYTNCKYLYQSDYNDKFDENKNQSGITREFYSNLEQEDIRVLSFPYSEELFKEEFSFKPISTLNAHYGDWPVQEKIDTSLVYFEKYVSASNPREVVYGYYGQGRPKDSEDSAMTWTLDTLLTQDDLDQKGYVVKEDGYAILTMYNVKKMTYTLNGTITGTITCASDTNNDGIVDMKAGTKSGTTYTDGEFALIDHPQKMTVKTKSNESFTISALYIFELPFELQEERTGAKNSYNNLKIQGYEEGNADAAFSYEYYYCPHFARSVVGPDVNKNEAGQTDLSDMYVRTARQLNALGRYYYYWNTTNSGRNEKFTFHQELDLDFKNYTTTYCGVTFNLMDTTEDNAYRNRPIGQEVNGTVGNTYIQFMAKYYGNGFEIKDYCLTVHDLSGKENIFKYSGLFGEIKGAEIYDVHMVSTDGEAYVRSYCKSTNGTGGVGGLVGIIYDEGSSKSIVKNCSISGYTVEYNIKECFAETGHHVAVGGLVGMCTGELTNSSAVCKLVTATIGNAKKNDVGVGGLVGSKKAGTLKNCYAGGAVSINVKSGSGTHTVGGISGGNVHTWIDGTNVKEDYSVQNCYSYVYADSSLTNTFYAVSPENSGCYYVVPTGSKTPTNGSATKLPLETLKGYVSDTSTKPDALASFGSADANHSYPWTESLKGSQYPFPAVVKSGSYAGGDTLYTGTSDEYVHYGDWLDADGKWPSADSSSSSGGDGGGVVTPDTGKTATGKIGVIRVTATTTGYWLWSSTTYSYKTFTYDFATKKTTESTENPLNVSDGTLSGGDYGYYIFTNSSLDYGANGWILKMNDYVIDDSLGTWQNGGTYQYVQASVAIKNMTLSFVRKDVDPDETLFTIEVDSSGKPTLQ